MKVYIIQHDLSCDLSLLDGVDIVDLSSLVSYDYAQESFLPIDVRKTLSIRGYPLSSLEYTTYYKHFIAWRDLEDSGDEFGLILENIKSIKYTLAEINNLIPTLDPDWHIYFPFDGFERKTTPNKSFVLGFRWGTDAYFINRRSLPVLLEQRMVSVPVDEQFLFLSEKSLLNIDYEDAGMFGYGENTKYEADCNSAKLDHILSINVWSEEDLNEARIMLQEISVLFKQNDIDFFISDGTLLGCIRHKQIMTWDDDIDLSVEKFQISKLVSLIDDIEKYSIIKRYWGKSRYEYYKIWDNRSRSIDNLPYGFPFVDVWIYEIKGSKIIYNHGLEIPLEKIFPLQESLFEGACVSIPRKPLYYLDIKYPDWREQLRVFTWSHKNEKSSLYPLTARIAVKDDGMICQQRNTNI